MVDLLIIVSLFLGILLVLAMVIIVTLVVRKRKYVAEITTHGWTFIDRPDIADTFGLTVPPFGRSFVRKVDDLVRGRTKSGVWFQMLEYRTDEYSGRVLTARLAAPLPEFHMLAGSRPRMGVTLPPLRGYEPCYITSTDPEFARELLNSPAREAIMQYGQRYPLDLTIDGQHLVAVGLQSEQPADIAAAAESLAAAVTAIPAELIQRFRQPEPAAHFAFYQNPDWHYAPRRDEILDTVAVTRGGFNHRTEHVVTSENDGLPFVAFRHHWQTTHLSSNGQGGTHTQTMNHVESVLEFALPFQTPEFSLAYDSSAKALLNLFRPLPEIDFEAEEFNKIFDIRCASQRFAYDVIKPQQMEYLQQTRPMPFYWGGRIARFKLGEYTPDAISWAADFFYGFLQRVPSFVWKDLQLPPPVRPLLN